MCGVLLTQSTALPKPQPPPALLSVSMEASSSPGLELREGVCGGVRVMFSTSLCVFQVKVWLKAGEVSGVMGRVSVSSLLLFCRFRSEGRLAHLRRGDSLEKVKTTFIPFSGLRSSREDGYKKKTRFLLCRLCDPLPPSQCPPVHLPRTWGPLAEQTWCSCLSLVYLSSSSALSFHACL